LSFSSIQPSEPSFSSSSFMLQISSLLSSSSSIFGSTENLQRLDFSLQDKNPFFALARMGSPGDNLRRYIDSSSEGLWVDPLQCRIPHLLGYPLMHYVSQDNHIIAFLERIVKSNRTYKQCPCLFTRRTARFFSLSCRKGSDNKPGVSPKFSEVRNL